MPFYLPERPKCGFLPHVQDTTEPSVKALRETFSSFWGEIGFPDNAKFNLFAAKPVGVFQ